MNRRELLNSALAAVAASSLVSDSAAANSTDENSSADSARDGQTPFKAIDTNISLFRWPFRSLPLDEPEAMVKKLRSLGISLAFAGSFEALLHRDLASVNRRLFDLCKRYPELAPIGSVNLDLPAWEDDFSRCVDDYNMPGVRLYPNYHGYELKDPRFAKLMKRAAEAGRFVQIAAALEDTRTQHSMLRVPDVDLTLLPKIVSEIAGAKVQILNCRPSSSLLESLADSPGLFLDTSRVDSTDGVAKLIQRFPASRILFGTHSPFLIPESSMIRVIESNLSQQETRQVMWENAEGLCGSWTP